MTSQAAVCSYSSDTEIFVRIGVAIFVLLTAAGVASAAFGGGALARLWKSAPMQGWLSELSLHSAFYGTIYATYLGISGCGSWNTAFVSTFLALALGSSLLFKFAEHGKH